MRRIFDNTDILDIVPLDAGFICLCREIIEDGSEAGIFYFYNRAEDHIYQCTVSDYIFSKYGENGKNAAISLGDFITCKCADLFNDDTVAVYPDGTFKILRNGRVTKQDKIEFLDSAVCSPAVSGRDLWLAVPDVNSVINYSLEHHRVEFRMGGPETKAFSHPVDIKIYRNIMYICNQFSFKIRKIDLNSYTVEDYMIFDEIIYSYFRSADDEYVHLESGIYLI